MGQGIVKALWNWRVMSITFFSTVSCVYFRKKSFLSCQKLPISFLLDNTHFPRQLFFLKEIRFAHICRLDLLYLFSFLFMISCERCVSFTSFVIKFRFTTNWFKIPAPTCLSLAHIRGCRRVNHGDSKFCFFMFSMLVRDYCWWYFRLIF